MVMPPRGTFHYLAIVPPDNQREAEWRVEMAEPVPERGDEIVRSRLVGYAPRLRITDVGTPAKDVNGISIRQARVMLRASGKRDAAVPEASFFIDLRIPKIFQTGDRLYMSRTSCAGLGISLIRGDRLVCAAGAVWHVPLGSGIEVRIESGIPVRIPSDSVPREPIPLSEGPPSRECTLQFEIEGQSRVLSKGRETIKSYEVSVLHGQRTGMPGDDECAAITLIGGCEHEAAYATALLLDSAKTLF